MGMGSEWKIVYEIFPVLTWRARTEPVDWLEVVLHTEAVVDPAAMTALEEAVDGLVRRLKAGGLWEVRRSAWYYTTGPWSLGQRVRLFRSVSVAVDDVPPYSRESGQPDFLLQLEVQMEELGILGATSIIPTEGRKRR